MGVKGLVLCSSFSSKCCWYKDKGKTQGLVPAQTVQRAIARKRDVHQYFSIIRSGLLARCYSSLQLYIPELLTGRAGMWRR